VGDFVDALIQRSPSPPRRTISPELRRQCQPFEMQADAPLTVERLIQRLNEALEDDTIIIADPGDALFASTDLVVHDRTEFIAPAYYTSMGFAVPAAVGAMCARPGQRVVVLVGDGAFQMTGMELSTTIQHGFAPIVIVLDNRGYGTERKLHPGDWKYNDIHPWHYAMLPSILGGGTGYDVLTEGDFDSALRRAWADRKQMSLIHVHVDPTDFSQPLQRLAERLGARV
jgi:indolepyruvate decarboxylase